MIRSGRSTARWVRRYEETVADDGSRTICPVRLDITEPAKFVGYSITIERALHWTLELTEWLATLPHESWVDSSDNPTGETWIYADFTVSKDDSPVVLRQTLDQSSVERTIVIPAGPLTPAERRDCWRIADTMVQLLDDLPTHVGRPFKDLRYQSIEELQATIEELRALPPHPYQAAVLRDAEQLLAQLLSSHGREELDPLWPDDDKASR